MPIDTPISAAVDLDRLQKSDRSTDRYFAEVLKTLSDARTQLNEQQHLILKILQLLSASPPTPFSPPSLSSYASVLSGEHGVDFQKPPTPTLREIGTFVKGSEDEAATLSTRPSMAILQEVEKGKIVTKPVMRRRYRSPKK